MAVQYDSEKGLSGFIPDIAKYLKNRNAEISEAMSSLFSNIFNDDNTTFIQLRDKLLATDKFDVWCNSLHISSQAEKEFLKTWDGIGDVSKSYQQHLVDSGKATSTLSTITSKAGGILKSFGATLSSMVAMWAIGEVIGLAMTAIDNYVNRVKYAQDALDEAKSNFDSSTSEIESLNGELETTQSRMAELQNLADNGTISVTEEKELENLKEQNAELERSIYLEKLKAKNSAKEELENAKVIADEKVISKYGGTKQEYTSLDYNTETSSSEIVTHKYTSPDFVTNSKELQLATNRLKELQKERQDLIDQYNNGTLDAESYDQKISPIEKEIEDTETYAAGLYDKVGDIKQAGDDATAVNRKMSSSFKESYKEATQAVADYDSYIQDNTDSLNVNTDAAANNAMSKNNNDSTTSDSKPKPIAFKEAWNNLDTTDNDNYKNLKSTLTSLAESGQLTVDAFKNTKGATAWAESIGLSAEEATKKINDLTDSSKQLSTLKTAMDSIQNAYSEKSENGIVGADTLSSMESTFGSLGDSWEKYKQVAGSAKTDTNDLKKAQDELATAYINSNNFLSGLVDETGECTEANKQYYIGQLEGLGIKNAEEVVNNSIIRQKADLALSDENLEGKSESEQIALINEAMLLAGNNEALQSYIFYKALASQNALDTTASIQNLINLANQCNITGQVLSHLNALLTAKEGYEEFINSGGSINDPESTYFLNTIEYNEQWLKTHKETDKGKTKKNNNNGQIDLTNKNVSPTKQTPTKSTAPTKQTFNWIERRVKNFQTKFNRWKNQAEKSATKFIDKYFKNAASNAKKLMNTDSSAYSKYMSKANSIKFSKKEKGYRDKVVSGKMSIEDVKDDKDGKLIKKIQNYQDYYDKAQSALDSFVDAAEDFYNIPLDKAAVKVEKFNDAIDLLDKKLDNAIGYEAKNKLIDKQTEQQKSIKKANKKAQNKTDKNVTSTGKALKKSNILNSSDVSKKEKKAIKKAVKNKNEVDLTYFKEGSKAYKAAVKYNEAIRANKNASDEAAKAQEDYNRWLVESAKLQFDNISDDYEKKIQVLGYDTSYNDRKIAEIEASGAIVDRSYYEKKSKVNDQIKAQYQNELTTLEQKLGSIKKGTDEWYDAKDAIEACKDSISECTQNTYELNNEINQLHFDNFERFAEDIERIISEQEFLQGLFDHENLTDDETGNFTEAGIAKLGSLSASYYASKEKSSKDEAEVKELKRMLDSGSLHSNALGITFNSVDDLKAKLKEMYTQWQDDIKETYRLESSIVDEMKEKYQSELDLLNKLIDDKKTALQTEKDLHDYQRTITEKTNDISTIQKQIAAYSGDTSQEGFAKLQKLQKELADKEEDLRETEYERYISDQEDMLDKLYTEYEELITKKLDDFMALVSEGLNVGNTNTEITKSYLESIMKDFGYTGEFDQNGIFNVASDGSLKDNISKILSGSTTNNTSTINTSTSENPGHYYSTEAVNKIASGIYTNYTLNDKTKVEAIFGNTKYYDKGKKKKASDYETSINQYLFKENKKVLSSDGLKALRNLLGVTNEGIKAALQEISDNYGNIKNVGGFKNGGIAKLVKSQGEDGIAMVRNGEGLISPEDVPEIKNLLDTIPLMNNFTNSLIKPDIPNIAPVNRVGNNIEATYNFTLENCNNADDIIRQIQTSPKVQKAIQSVSVDRIAGGGRLNVRNIR